jgi:hypothetical protein
MEPRQSFYSFRHSWRDALRRIDAQPATLQALAESGDIDCSLDKLRNGCMPTLTCGSRIDIAPPPLGEAEVLEPRRRHKRHCATILMDGLE